MGATNDYFQRLIHQAMARPTGNVLEVSDQLWHSLSKQLIAMIGEGGFNALLARSVSLAQVQFTWLTDCDVGRSAEEELDNLKNNIERCSGDQAGKVNEHLLMTFVTNLADLIGQPLTAGILSASWGVDTAPGLVEEELDDDR